MAVDGIGAVVEPDEVLAVCGGAVVGDESPVVVFVDGEDVQAPATTAMLAMAPMTPVHVRRFTIISRSRSVLPGLDTT